MGSWNVSPRMIGEPRRMQGMPQAQPADPTQSQQGRLPSGGFAINPTSGKMTPTGGLRYGPPQQPQPQQSLQGSSWGMQNARDAAMQNISRWGMAQPQQQVVQPQQMNIAPQGPGDWQAMVDRARQMAAEPQGPPHPDDMRPQNIRAIPSDPNAMANWQQRMQAQLQQPREVDPRDAYQPRTPWSTQPQSPSYDQAAQMMQRVQQMGRMRQMMQQPQQQDSMGGWGNPQMSWLQAAAPQQRELGPAMGPRSFYR